MNDKSNQTRSRNVTAKDVVAVVLILSVLLPLIWFKESGEAWAANLLALIPIIGLIGWLRIPAQRRAQAEQEAKAELHKSALGRGLKYFIWAVIMFAAAITMKSLVEWVQSA